MPRVILIFGVLVAIFVGLLFFSGYLSHQRQLAQQKITTVPVSSSAPGNDQSAFSAHQVQPHNLKDLQLAQPSQLTMLQVSS